MSDIDKIITLLSSLTNIVIRYGWYDETLSQDHITFTFLDTAPSDFEDDCISTLQTIVQIDFWSKQKPLHELCEQAIFKLREHGLFLLEKKDLHEAETKIFRIGTRFVFTKEDGKWLV